MKNSNIEILTLVENTVHQAGGLLAEHGLSFFISVYGKNILFDTGAGNVIVNNAEKLGADLNDLDAIALSHGHNDHAGGLKEVLKSTSEIDIYAHPAIFEKKLVVKGENVRKAYIPQPRSYYEEMGANFKLSREPVKITDEVLLIGQVPRRNDFEKMEDVFYKETDEGYVPDELLDDQAMVIFSDKGLVVVLGCSHSGVINTLEHILDITGEKEIYAVVGGTHLKDADEERIKKTSQELESFNINILAPSHCTGFRASAHLYSEYGEAFQLNNVGSRIII